MKDVNDVMVTIAPTEVKSVRYDNTFKIQAGQQVKLAIKNTVGVQTSPTNPVAAHVLSKITVEDETKNISFEIETITPVTTSTYVDNLEEFIKRRYMSVVMLAVNEKVRNVTTLLGIPVRLPALRFGTQPADSAEVGTGLTQ